jgi:hypothetical protein
MLRKAFSLAVLAAAATPACAQSVQPWPDLLAIVPAGGGWSVSAELIGRAGGDARPSQVESRLQVAHALTRSLTASAGWVHYSTFVPRGANFTEEQAVEQLNWAVGAIGRLRVAARTRLEQRFISNVAGTNWRLRQQVRAVYALGDRGAPGLVVWGEPFVALNRTAGQRHLLDQLRTFTGVTVPVSPALDVEVGYLNQRVYRANDTVVNHAIPLVVTYRF